MANAERSTTLSRRQFSSAAAFAVFVAVKAVPSLTILIEAHKATKSAFEEVCGFTDHVEESDPRFKMLSAEYKARCSADDDAMTALCSYRPGTLAEVRQRGAYLAEHLVRNDLAPEQFDALLASLAA